MPRFRSIPTEKDAVLFTGENFPEIEQLTGNHHDYRVNHLGTTGLPQLEVRTIDGNIAHIEVGDYLVKGVAGELYPCKKEIFEATHEKVQI